MEETLWEAFKDVGKGLTRILISPFQALLDVGTAVGLISAANFIPGVNIPNVESLNIADAVFGEEESSESANGSAEEAPPSIGLCHWWYCDKPYYGINW